MSEHIPHNGRYEKESGQERIERVLDVIGHKIDAGFEHYKRLNAGRRLRPGSELTDAEMEAEFRHHIEFHLPARGKEHSLDVHLLAADFDVSPYSKESEHFGRENDIAEFVYRHRGKEKGLIETAEVFAVSRSAEGGLMLEKTIRDYTDANRTTARLYQLAMAASEDDNFEFERTEEAFIERDLKNRQAETAARKDERELGLTAASDEDLAELEALVDQAEPDLD